MKFEVLGQVFSQGDEVAWDRMWVSSDGPLPGYVHYFTGELEKVTPKFVWVKTEDRVRKLTYEKFIKFNSEMPLEERGV